MMTWDCPKCGKSNEMEMLSSMTGCGYSYDTVIAHCSCGISYEVQTDILDEEGESEPDALARVTPVCGVCGDEYDIEVDGYDEWKAELSRNICEFCLKEAAS